MAAPLPTHMDVFQPCLKVRIVQNKFSQPLSWEKCFLHNSVMDSSVVIILTLLTAADKEDKTSIKLSTDSTVPVSILLKPIHIWLKCARNLNISFCLKFS